MTESLFWFLFISHLLCLKRWNIWWKKRKLFLEIENETATVSGAKRDTRVNGKYRIHKYHVALPNKTLSFMFSFSFTLAQFGRCCCCCQPANGQTRPGLHNTNAVSHSSNSWKIIAVFCFSIYFSIGRTLYRRTIRARHIISHFHTV